MAKINRYTGDLKAFASNSTGTNRTVFGDITQSDALTDNVNADYLLGWEIVGVNDKPKKQHFNALGYTMGQLHSYIHQMGVPEWDSLQEFPATAITNRNGAFYISQQIHTGQDPELDTANIYWSNPLDVSEFYTDSGATDAYVLASADGKAEPNSYSDGHKLSFIASSVNTGASTVNVSGLGVKNIKLSGGADPAAGDISGRTELVYDAANGWFELSTPINSYIKLTDTKAAGASGGSFTSGAWQTRVINTENNDSGGYCTLSANQFTLLAGSYKIFAQAAGSRVNGHKARLRNISDSTTTLVGSAAYAPAASNSMSYSQIIGKFSIATSKTFEIQHYCQTTDANGFGIDQSGDSESAIYTIVEMERVS